MLSASEMPTDLPPGSGIVQIQFVPQTQASQTDLHRLPASTGMKAIEGNSNERGVSPTLQILTIPAKSLDDPQLAAAAKSWVENAKDGTPASVLPIVLQGAQILWSTERAAIIAPADRLLALRGAVIEFCYFEAEARSIEAAVTNRWSQLDADTPLAFEFREPATLQRSELLQRFQQAISLRSRLVRMAPHIECPQVYPPTLVSQAGERLREKSRLSDRLGFLREQIEVFERVYELCGQRFSDFVANRKSHTLEWIIIVLLAVETILLLVSMLASSASET